VAILCPLARMYPHSRASRDDSQPECQQYRPHSSNAGSTLTISIRVTRPRAGAEGQSFGAVGPFEHITGRAHGEVDPGLPRKAPANRDALTTLQLRDANTSSSSFRCRPTLFFIPASDCDAMLRPRSAVWHRASHRALRRGRPACAGQSQRRHGSGEHLCMQR